MSVASTAVPRRPRRPNWPRPAAVAAAVALAVLGGAARLAPAQRPSAGPLPAEEIARGPVVDIEPEPPPAPSVVAGVPMRPEDTPIAALECLAALRRAPLRGAARPGEPPPTGARIRRRSQRLGIDCGAGTSRARCHTLCRDLCLLDGVRLPDGAATVVAGHFAEGRDLALWVLPRRAGTPPARVRIVGDEVVLVDEPTGTRFAQVQSRVIGAPLEPLDLAPGAAVALYAVIWDHDPDEGWIGSLWAIVAAPGGAISAHRRLDFAGAD